MIKKTKDGVVRNAGVKKAESEEKQEKPVSYGN